MNSVRKIKRVLKIEYLENSDFIKVIWGALFIETPLMASLPKFSFQHIPNRVVMSILIFFRILAILDGLPKSPAKFVRA